MPAETLEASATFVMERSAQRTAIAIGPTDFVALFPEVTEAELFTVPQFAEEVGEPMWTERLPPGASEVPVPPHVRTPVVIEQVQPAETPPVVQVKVPGVEGSVSVIWTFVAVPVPTADELETVIV